MEKLLKFYKGKLELKNRRIAEYIQENNSIDGFKSTKRKTEYYVLKAELELIKRFVGDLENI